MSKDEINQNNAKLIGICTRSVIWMHEEGFFAENPKIACSTWIKSADDVILEAIESFYIDLLRGAEINDKHSDVALAMVFIESIKSGKNENFTFTDEQAEKWTNYYGIASTLERERRKGNIEVKSHDVPLEMMRWRDIKFQGQDWKE